MTEKIKSVYAISHSISEPILTPKNENSCPNKQGKLKFNFFKVLKLKKNHAIHFAADKNEDHTSSVFKNTLFYPHKYLQIKNDVKKKRKEKLPAVATSSAWRK